MKRIFSEYELVKIAESLDKEIVCFNEELGRPVRLDMVSRYMPLSKKELYKLFILEDRMIAISLDPKFELKISFFTEEDYRKAVNAKKIKPDYVNNPFSNLLKLLKRRGNETKD